MHPNSPDVDSNSIKYQYYHPEVYDEYIREDEKSGKQNNFVRMGLKTEVLYNPERDENGVAIDGGTEALGKEPVISDEEKKRKADEAKAFRDQMKAAKAADDKAAKALAAAAKKASDTVAPPPAKSQPGSSTKEITVNDIVFVVTAGENGLTAKQKDGDITADAKNLTALKIELQGKTKIK